MPKFKITVEVTCDTIEQASQVASERLGYDEDYGFEYRFGNEFVEPVEDEDYTTAPELIRIHDEGDGWAIDGATHGGRYTESVWKYDTIEEAAENVPAYIRHIRAEGYTIG